MGTILVLKPVPRTEHVKRNYRLFGRSIDRGNKHYEYTGSIEPSSTVKLTDSVYYVGEEVVELSGVLSSEEVLLFETCVTLDEVKKNV